MLSIVAVEVHLSVTIRLPKKLSTSIYRVGSLPANLISFAD